MGRRAPGEGTLYQRSDGRWVGAIQYRDAAGRKRRKPVYGRSQSEARQKLRQAITSLDAGLPIPDARTTLGAWLNDWLAQEVRPRLAWSTYQSYESYVRVHIIPAIGKVSLAKLTPGHVERLMNGMLKEGLSPRSVQLTQAILRRALARAEKWGLVARNVASLVDPPTQYHKEFRLLEPAETQRLMDTLQDERLWALFFVALTLGLRSGELRGLRWIDVDLNAGQLQVQQSIQRIEGTLQAKPPKTEKSRRRLPLPAVTCEALRQHRERQELEREFAGGDWRDHGLVFTTRIGTPIDAANLTHEFQRALARHGFPRMRLHDLRHACASYLISSGVEMRIVMEILGHSQISLTANLYAHVLPLTSAIALSKMDDLFRMPEPLPVS